jgi:hypothetical protein
MGVDPDVLKIAFDGARLRDRAHDGHLTASGGAFGDVNLEHPGQHFGPRGVLGARVIGRILIIRAGGHFGLKPLFDMRLQRDVLTIGGVWGEDPTPSDQMAVWRRNQGGKLFWVLARRRRVVLITVREASLDHFKFVIQF